MNILRKLFCCLAATMLVTFALPISAADNKFFHAIFPATIPTGTGVQIQVSIFNTSPPPGQSTMNSLQFVAPAGVTITAVSPGTMTPVGGGTSVIIDNIPGIGRGSSRTFTLTLNVTATGCTPGTWGVAANTGNAYPRGTEFALNGQQKLDSLLGCDVILSSCSPPSSYTEVSPTGNTTTIERLEKPGFPCDPTGFNVLFTDLGNTVEVQWTGQVLLKATTIWPLSLVDPQTTQHKKTWVAWEKDGSNNWILIPVPYCTSDQAPTAAPITDPFPVINSTAVMPGPGGTTLIANPYVGQRARICAIAERNVVVDPNAPEASSCPAQPSGLDADVVLGCVYRETVLYVRDDIIWANR